MEKKNLRYSGRVFCVLRCAIKVEFMRKQKAATCLHINISHKILYAIGLRCDLMEVKATRNDDNDNDDDISET